MEKQIHRIKAEGRLADLTHESSKNKKDAFSAYVENLTLELGDTYRIKRERFVAPEPGAAEKLRRLSGGI